MRKDNEKLIIEEYREPVYDIVLSILTGFAGGAVVPIVGYLNKMKEERDLKIYQKSIAETEELAKKITDSVFRQLEQYTMKREKRFDYEGVE